MTENILKRDDKIALSGGKKVLWAPAFPRYAHKFGFWDYAYFLNYRIAPLFTVTILDEDLNEIPLNRIQREWLPSHLTQLYMPYEEIEVKEEKSLLPNDVLVSRITLKNNSSRERKLTAVAWTSQSIQENITHRNPEKTPNSNYIQDTENSERLFAFQRRINNDKGNLLIRYGVAIGTRRKANSFSISTSEYVWNYPEWRLTPFYEKITRSGLPNDSSFKGIVQDPDYRELVYLGLEYQIVLPPKSSHELQIYCAISDEQEDAMDALVLACQFADPICHSKDSWQRFFDGVPTFRCSNQHLEKYYWYRWFGLRKNLVDTDSSLGLAHPCIFEGSNPSELRHQTSLSAPAHILETRWMQDPGIANGCLSNFISNQRRDGSFPGMLSTGYHTQHSGFYHANWGKSIRELYRIHPNRNLLATIYSAMKKYTRYFNRERDKNDWHLYDILSTEETGLECSSRYLFVSRKGDRIENIPLKGVEVSVYMYEIFKTLAWIAKKLGYYKDIPDWETEASNTKTAILKYMWDDKKNFFFDINPFSGNHSSCKAASGFFPFITDIASEKHLEIFTDHLFNPREFWTPFPIPSVSLDDRHYNPFGEWEERRRARPSNGRSWMMITSHVFEALVTAAQNLKPELKPKAGEFFLKYINMLFDQGNVKYPTSFEYYNPLQGKPPYFRGSNDHINSWIVDLIIKYVVGLQPMDDGLIVIDPLPLNLDFFLLENILVKGHNLKISYSKELNSQEQKGIYIYINNELREHKEQLQRIEIQVTENF
ncbi:MAG: MGH1-like glycoside hydrolase domain-containing protein [Methanosarcinaceae archaeon]